MAPSFNLSRLRGADITGSVTSLINFVKYNSSPCSKWFSHTYKNKLYENAYRTFKIVTDNVSVCKQCVTNVSDFSSKILIRRIKQIPHNVNECRLNVYWFKCQKCQSIAQQHLIYCL